MKSDPATGPATNMKRKAFDPFASTSVKCPDHR